MTITSPGLNWNFALFVCLFFILKLLTIINEKEKNTQSNHMLYVYLYLYTKHFSRLHSKAYICRVKIEGCSKLLRMALSFSPMHWSTWYLISRMWAQCLLEKEKLYQFKCCEASKSTNSGNDEQNQFWSGFSLLFLFAWFSDTTFILYDQKVVFVNTLALNLFPGLLSSMRSLHSSRDGHILIFIAPWITKSKEQKHKGTFIRISALISICVFSPFLTKFIVKSTSLCGLVLHISIQELVFLPAAN